MASFQALWSGRRSTSAHEAPPEHLASSRPTDTACEAPAQLARGVSDSASGEATVRNPQKSDGVRKFVTYEVTGFYRLPDTPLDTASGADGPFFAFSVRRRYSDFVWLRNILHEHAPGILLPVLPEKQQLGRFKDEFLEKRCSGLERFLQTLLQRSELLAKPSFLLVRFLTDVECLDGWKCEFESRTLVDVNTEFRLAFAYALAGSATPRGSLAGPGEDESRLQNMKAATERHMLHLVDAVGSTSKLCEGYRRMSDLTTNVHSNICTLRENNLTMPTGGLHSAPSPCDTPVLSALEKHCAVYAASPVQNFDVLLASLEHERDQTYAMRDALQSIAALEKRIVELKKRVEADIALQNRVTRRRSVQEAVRQAAAPPPMEPRHRKRDMFLDMIDSIRGKDPLLQIDDAGRELQKDEDDVAAGEEFLTAAKAVCAGTEMRSYSEQLVKDHQAADATLQAGMAKTTRDVAEIWANESSVGGPHLHNGASKTIRGNTLCKHGCGWSAFGGFSTCCTNCSGPTGPHASDCAKKNTAMKSVTVAGLCGVSAG